MMVQGGHPPASADRDAAFERHRVSLPRAASTAVLWELTLVEVKGDPSTPFEFHGDGGNVLYLDGHVVSLRRGELGSRDWGANSVEQTVKDTLTDLDGLAGGGS